MLSSPTKFFLNVLFLFFSFAILADAQTPTPTPQDDTERIFTEEIKLNVTAFDRDGRFVGDVKKEDLVITEDGRLNQANSIRRIPANVLIVMDTGGELRAAKSFKQTGMSGVTMVGDVAGTIAYMPPEQVRDFKEVRPPSDIYGVGMTAYSLLTGAHALDISPHAGISETVKAIFEKPIVPINRRVPEIPLRVAAVIETALAKEVDFRWHSAREMREALLRAME